MLPSYASFIWQANRDLEIMPFYIRTHTTITENLFALLDMLRKHRQIKESQGGCGKPMRAYQLLAGLESRF